MDKELITLWTPGVGKKRMFISNIRECKYSENHYYILDVDPQRDDDASPMSTYRWNLLEC